MLSAVENHLGPGRPYYAGPSLSHLVPPSAVPQVQIPTGLPNSAMSATEFVRPHPKIKCNAPPSLSPTRSKYATEQNGPVNLAVGPSSNSPNSVPSPSNSISPKDERSPHDIGNGSQPSPKEAFSPSRLPYPTSPAALTGAASMYQQALNYSLYRGGYPLYPPPHPLAAARSLQRPFMSGQLEPYPTFIPSVPFTPPQLSSLPPGPTVIPTSLSNHNQNGVKMNHHGNGQNHHGLDHRMPPNNVPPPPSPHHLHHHLQQQQQQIPLQMHKSELTRTKDKSPNQINHNNNTNNNLLHLHNLQNHNLNNNNNGGVDSLGFKVPSGKEGSLKHRILTRPYDKEAKQRSPTSGTNGGSISFAR